MFRIEWKLHAQLSNFMDYSYNWSYNLTGKLKGKALTVCSGLPPVVVDNYKVIWQNLIDKYQDKRLLADTYLKQILQIKTLTTYCFCE